MIPHSQCPPPTPHIHITSKIFHSYPHRIDYPFYEIYDEFEKEGKTWLTWELLPKSNLEQSYLEIYVWLTDLYAIKHKPWKIGPKITFSF